MDNEYETPWDNTQLEEPTRSEIQPSQQNDDELGIHTEVAIKKTRHVAKLDDTRLLGEKGLGALKHLCSKISLKGNGHEVGDLRRLLEMYQMWSHDLFPKGQFSNMYALASKAGRSASVRNLRLAWIDEERTAKKNSARETAEEEVGEINDFRDRGRHFETESRYARQSASAESPPRDFSAGAESVDNPDDLFVGLDSVDHRVVSDDDAEQEAEVSRIEEEETEEQQDVHELLEGARAQRQDDNSRSSGRASLFDTSNLLLDESFNKEKSQDTQPISSSSNKRKRMDELALDLDEADLEIEEPPFDEEQYQNPIDTAQDYDDDEEMAVLREMGM